MMQATVQLLIYSASCPSTVRYCRSWPSRLRRSDGTLWLTSLDSSRRAQLGRPNPDGLDPDGENPARENPDRRTWTRRTRMGRTRPGRTRMVNGQPGWSTLVNPDGQPGFQPDSSQPGGTPLAMF